MLCSPQDVERKKKSLLSSEPVKPVTEWKHFRKELPNNHLKHMKAFLPNYPFSRRHSIRIFLQPSVLFVSGSVLLYGKGQGPSQTYPKASNFPVAEVPPLSSRATSESPAQDKSVFSTEALK